MLPLENENPASLAASAAPNSFCLVAERSEAIESPRHYQANVIGIDPGIAGALALVSRDGDLIDVADMPTLGEGSGGRAAVNAPLVADLLARWHAREVFCEFVSARPKEGAVGAFSFGRSRCVIEGACAALGLPIRFLTPPVWSRAVGLPAGRERAKDAARSEAIRHWPNKAALFARVKDDGRAEAGSFALAGPMLEGGRWAALKPSSKLERRFCGIWCLKPWGLSRAMTTPVRAIISNTSSKA
jgi:crossover junction endodeoxyribonuclease RuvC